MSKRTYSNEVIMDALERKRGVISETAEFLKCSRTTIHERINNEDEVAACVKRIRANERESLEQIIYAVCKDTEHRDWFKAIRYYMRVIHGVNEQQLDVTTGGQPIQLVPVSQVKEEE